MAKQEKQNQDAISTSIEKEIPKAVDQKLIEETKKNFEDFANEINKKLYIVAGGNKTSEAIMKFLTDDAQWTAHEALGVVKAYEDVKDATKNGKELMLPVLCIKAVSYFTGKVSGVGLEAAKNYKDNLFTPLNDAMGRISNDEKKLEDLKHKWAAAVQGINPDSAE